MTNIAQRFIFVLHTHTHTHKQNANNIECEIKGALLSQCSLLLLVSAKTAKVNIKETPPIDQALILDLNVLTQQIDTHTHTHTSIHKRSVKSN